jgi:predicted transposase/invertase (TIGR01784 family)
LQYACQPQRSRRSFYPAGSDYGFKIIFGNKRNSLFLRRALQALIVSAALIQEVSLDKNTFEAMVKDSRAGIYDLACVVENGTHFIVEMQVSDAPYFFQRMKFYAFHKFNSLVQKGNFDYNRLDRIYLLYRYIHLSEGQCLRRQGQPRLK